MNFSKYTFWELNKIYWQLGVEYIKRIWWVVVIIGVVWVISIIYYSKKQYL